MGRIKRWAEDMIARFPEGTFATIEALSEPGEERTDFVREAVEREMLRRWKVVRPSLLKHADETRTVERYRPSPRLTVLTSSNAGAADGPTEVEIPRSTGHFLDNLVIRAAKLDFHKERHSEGSSENESLPEREWPFPSTLAPGDGYSAAESLRRIKAKEAEEDSEA